MKNINKYVILMALIWMFLLSSCSDTKYTSTKDIMKDYFSFLENNNSKVLKLSCSNELVKTDAHYSAIIQQEKKFITDNKFSNFIFLWEEKESNKQGSCLTEYFDLNYNWKKKRSYVSIKNNSDGSLCIDYLDFSYYDWSKYRSDEELDLALKETYNGIYKNPTWVKYVRELDIYNIKDVINKDPNIKFSFQDIKNRLDKMNKEWILKISFTPLNEEDIKKDLLISIVELNDQFNKSTLFQSKDEEDRLMLKYINTINSIKDDNIWLSLNQLPLVLNVNQTVINRMINSWKLKWTTDTFVIDSDNLKAVMRSTYILDRSILNYAILTNKDSITKDDLIRVVNSYKDSTLIKDWTVKEKTEVEIIWKSTTNNNYSMYKLLIEPTSDSKMFKITYVNNISMNNKTVNTEGWVYVNKQPQYDYSEIDKQ